MHDYMTFASYFRTSNILGAFAKLRKRFLIFTRVLYVNDRMPDWELKMFANKRVRTHDIDILDGLVLAGFIV